MRIIPSFYKMNSYNAQNYIAYDEFSWSMLINNLNNINKFNCDQQ